MCSLVSSCARPTSHADMSTHLILRCPHPCKSYTTQHRGSTEHSASSLAIEQPMPTALDHIVTCSLTFCCWGVFREDEEGTLEGGSSCSSDRNLDLCYFLHQSCTGQNSLGFDAVFSTDMKYVMIMCHVSFVDLTYELTLKSFELTGKSSSPHVGAFFFFVMYSHWSRA